MDYKVFLKRIFFCFCALVFCTLLTFVLMYILIPVAVVNGMILAPIGDGKYELELSIAGNIAFLITYFFIAWCEGIIKKSGK